MHLKFGILILLVSHVALGASPLPYTTRSRAYTGWTNTVLGDIPSIGMAGALVGLGDSWTGSQMNPAGTAMTVTSTSISLTSNQFQDRYIQEYEQSIGINTTGGVFAMYPWGFSIGFSNPHSEEAQYINTANNRAFTASSKIKGFQVSASRIFLEDRLSVGLALSLNTATNLIGTTEESSFAIKPSLGVLYQPQKKFLLGASYQFSTSYSLNSTPSSPIISSFFQEVRSPSVFAIGGGWIPNASFRVGTSFLLIGPTTNTALLSDQSKITGANTTFQPRIGAAYQWLDLKHFTSRIFLGTYFEIPRVTGLSNRMHLTTGLEANAWIFTLGAGVDIAPSYKNMFFSFGLDPIKVMRLLEFIPPEYPRKRSGLLPKITRDDEDGLPRALHENWDPKKQRPSEDLLEIGTKLPQKIKKKMDQIFNNENKKKKKK